MVRLLQEFLDAVIEIFILSMKSGKTFARIFCPTSNSKKVKCPEDSTLSFGNYLKSNKMKETLSFPNVKIMCTLKVFKI